jgi:CheY-like chemotaxis protein
MWAGEVRQAAEFATTLTRQLLAFSRKQVLLTRRLNLNELITQTTRMISRLIGADLRLVTTLAPDLSPVRADPGQIEQILLNLAVNARDAMPNGGTLTVATANVAIDQAQLDGHETVTPGNYVELTMRDSGVGMSDEVKAHLFEPFFTTKEQGKGTGLGLAMVYGIVKQSGGLIVVTSEVGIGTAFRILLPRTEESAADAEPARVALAGDGDNTAVVLVVETNPGVRRFVCHCLRELQYTVIEAGSGAEAIQAAHQYSDDIDLLVTDTVLADFSGHQLRQLLAPTRPALKVLFMSGSSHTQLAFDDLTGAGTAFMHKPFSQAAPATKVREVLQG